MRADHLVIAASTPVLAGALYLLLAGDVSAAEAEACAPVVVLASLYAAALAKAGSQPVRLTLPAIPALARAAGKVVPDTLRVGRALLAAFTGAEGGFVRQPFRAGGDDPADAARRGVVVLGLSLAPNAFVVDTEAGAGLLLHVLDPAPVSSDREWPDG